MKGLLLELPYDPEKLGDEVVVDGEENVLELCDYYLGAALGLGFDELCREARAAGALVIPAHVDRPMFSVGSQLGFLPPGPYAAVESMREPPPELRLGYPAISGSDAHYPEHVGRRPFGLELPEGLLAAASEGEGGAGEALLSALAEALKCGAFLPSWARGAREGGA